MTVLKTQEQQQIDRANAQGKQPVVFIHGLWHAAQVHRRRPAIQTQVSGLNHPVRLVLAVGVHLDLGKQDTEQLASAAL